MIVLKFHFKLLPSSIVDANFLCQMYPQYYHRSIVRIGLSKARSHCRDVSSQVVTESLSGAKNISKIVPPYSHFIGNGGNARIKTNGGRNARLLVSGPDASGIVASFSQLLFEHKLLILDCTSESSEKDDYESKNGSDGRMFFQRILFNHSNMRVGRDVIEGEISLMCQRFGMDSRLVSFEFSSLHLWTFCFK